MKHLENFIIFFVGFFSVYHQSLGNDVPRKTINPQHIITGSRVLTDRSITKHVVSVRRGNYFTFYDHRCGGAILSSTTVLTAAHCVVDKNNKVFEHIFIIAGSTFTEEIPDSGRVYKIDKIDVHPDYKYGGLTEDVAILHTKFIQEDGKYIERVPIAKREAIPGEDCIVAGWGNVEVLEQEFPLNLMVATQKICSSEFEFDGKSKGVLCAGDPEDWSIAVQRGDSGSPLLCSGNISGIVSFDYATPTSKYYTDVFYYRQWISQNHVQNHRKPTLIVLFIIFFAFFWSCLCKNPHLKSK